MRTQTTARKSKGKKHNGRHSNGRKPVAGHGAIQHPEHPVSKEFARALAGADAAREAALKARRALAIAARPTAEERRKRTALIGSALDVDLPAFSKGVRELNAAYARRVKSHHLSAADAAVLTQGSYFGDATQWDLFTPPVDRHFWWASTNWFWQGGLQAEDLPDGLHFFGNRSYDGDDLIGCSVGAVALFELQADRRPPSPTGRLNSEPKIELFGTIDGWTGVYDWLLAADDKWCKCNLFTRQTAFQFSLGQFLDLAERTEVRNFLDEENESRSVHVPMPGWINMPAIQFGGAPSLSVFVQLEVRFDIQLEGDSYIGFSPKIPVPDSAGSVLLRFQQWEPIPV